MCMCSTCMDDALRDHRSVSDSIELELQIIVSHHLGVRTKLRSFEKSVSVLSH